MNYKKVDLEAGLYFVATPIGHARDITLRALDILQSADVLVAEDTRSLRRLMDIHGIALKKRPLISYHDHSTDKTRNRIIDLLRQGKSVAYMSEAGTPLIADPGYELSQDAIKAQFQLTAAPGCSALLPALMLSGLPTDRFLFEGFLPSSKSARRAHLERLRTVTATLVFYESPKRLAAMLQDACETFGDDRQAAFCRELTKKFEEVRRGTLRELCDVANAATPKGECVVLIGKADKEKINETDIESEIEAALKTMSLRDASEAIANAYGLPKRDIYQMALKLAKKE